MNFYFKPHWLLYLLLMVTWSCKTSSTSSPGSASTNKDAPALSSDKPTPVVNEPKTATENSKPIQWLTFEEAIKKSSSEKKPIFIDVYTDWCGWCKVMDKNTFNDPQVAKLLNEKFYAVKFDAEQKEDVVFNGNTFKFVASGGNGYHELAAALLNNQLSYPTVVFLTENFEMIQPLAGYRKAPEFHKIAQFIGEGHYKSVKWTDWDAKYTSPY